MLNVSSRSTLVPTPVLFEVSCACVVVLGKNRPAPKVQRSSSAGWCGTWAAAGAIAPAANPMAARAIRDFVFMGAIRRGGRAAMLCSAPDIAPSLRRFEHPRCGTKVQYPVSDALPSFLAMSRITGLAHILVRRARCDVADPK